MPTQRRVTSLLALAFVLLCGGCAVASRPDPPPDLGRGHRWIRSHPFTLMALVLRPRTYDGREYAACNLNTALLWKPENALFEETVRTGLPWHGHAKSRRFYGNEGRTRFDEIMQSRMRQLVEEYPGCAAWMVWDEPERDEIELAARIARWTREAFPDTLVYTNANPGGHPEFRGMPPRDGYGYGTYLRDITGTIQPDVLMVDIYPFFKQPFGDRIPHYRFNALQVRNAALEAGIPYWMFVQAYSEAVPGNNNDRRYPSESDLRMQVFTSLAMGYTGIAYFLFCPGFERTMLDEDGTPGPLYHHAARLNTELRHLGRTLRFLRSTDVRFVTGHHDENGRTASNEEDRFIDAWDADAGHASGLGDIRITGAGRGRDGLVGLFEDDDGQPYFMLVNLWHGEGAAASAKETTFEVTLAPGVKKVRRLSRDTGRAERLRPKNGVLRVTLPGGTGDLFTTGRGGFPGM
ncbi:MAG: hypothetical protein CMJ18_26970 [Phycisphaeraceae bacterium]|nr:hypothetical protein [Phycisphaeraceae bacterium]